VGAALAQLMDGAAVIEKVVGMLDHDPAALLCNWQGSPHHRPAGHRGHVDLTITYGG
jgi:hypothetical protein